MGAEPTTHWQVEWESESKQVLFPQHCLLGAGRELNERGASVP